MKEYKSNIPELTLKFKTGDVKKVKVTSSKDSADFLRNFYDQDTIELTESFIVLFLNRANTTIGWFKVSSGGLNGCIVDVKLIISVALKCMANSIVVSHNHPSGNLKPSKADNDITTKLNAACKLMEIVLLDHVIITETGHYSFADEGLI